MKLWFAALIFFCIYLFISAIVFAWNLIMLARLRHFEKIYVENISSDERNKNNKNLYITIPVKRLLTRAGACVPGIISRSIIDNHYSMIESYIDSFNKADSIYYQRRTRALLWPIGAIEKIPFNSHRYSKKQVLL